MKRTLATLMYGSTAAARLGAAGLLVLLTVGCANQELVRRQIDRVSPTLELAQSEASPLGSLQRGAGRAD